MSLTRRALGASALSGLGLVSLPLVARPAMAAPTTITIDWATYNPVSLVLKGQSLLEKEFEKDKIAIR